MKQIGQLRKDGDDWVKSALLSKPKKTGNML